MKIKINKPYNPTPIARVEAIFKNSRNLPFRDVSITASLNSSNNKFILETIRSSEESDVNMLLDENELYRSMTPYKKYSVQYIYRIIPELQITSDCSIKQSFLCHYLYTYAVYENPLK